MLKKPLKNPFSTNSKKSVVNAVKGECQSLETVVNMGNSFNQVADKLQKEYQTLLGRSYITKRKNAWYQSY